ncbi:MAG TPA: hypothetical protein VIJ68_04135 [Candidatus Saccharimonadales bacterium]
MSVSSTETAPKALDFTQEFDGSQPELTSAEKLEAATLFKSGVQDVFLKHIDRVERLDGEVALYPYDYSALSLSTVLEDGTRLSFTAKSFDTETDPPYELEVSEGVSFDKPYRHVRYSLDPEGDEVRRFDMNHQPLPEATQRALGSLSSSSTITQRGVIIDEDGAKRIDPEEFEEAKEGMLFIWDDEFKRRDVERQLGVNDQPVSPEEVRTLLGLLEQAEPEF